MSYLINNDTKEIFLTRGDTLKVTINLLKDGLLYQPEEGDVIRFAMKKNFDRRARVLINKVIPNDTLELHLEPEDTKKYNFGDYVYDIQITFANGDVYTFIKGVIRLEEEVQ